MALPRHLPAFEEILYSPPHLIYVFLAPFWVIRHVVKANSLVPYFVTARLFSIGAGLATIWFTYRAARRIFPASRPAAIFAAYFLATSILAIAVSASARHWPFAALLAMLGFAVLISTERKFSVRFLWTAVIAGVGMGINQIIGALMVIAPVWQVAMERGKVKRLASAWWFYAGIGIFALLTALPFLIFSYSLLGVGKKMWAHAPTLWGLASAPAVFLAPIMKSEPILFLFCIMGFAALWRTHRRLFWILAGIVIGYAELFQVVYFFQHRFLAILMPFLALIAGFGASSLLGTSPYRRSRAVVLGLLLAMPLMASLRFSYLLSHGDSRALARAWFETHIPEGSRVMVWGHLMRFASERSAIREKALIEAMWDMDDTNEYDFPDMSWGKRFHALNLFDVQTEAFYKDIVRYACVREYEYAVIQEGSDFQPPWRRSHMERLVAGAERVRSFGVSDEKYSVTATQFDGWPWTMLGFREFGPMISIYRLNRETLCGDAEDSMRTIFEGRQALEWGMARAHHFALTGRQNLHIDISSDRGVEALLFSESEFAAWQAGAPPKPLFRVEGPKEIIPLESGRYVLAVGAPKGAALYSLTLRTDELFYRK